MALTGMAISQSTGVAVPTARRTGGRVSSALQSLARRAHIEKPEMRAYDIDEPVRKPASAAVNNKHLASPAKERIHLIMGTGRGHRAQMPQIIAIVAKEENGQIVNYRTGYSR